MTNQLNKFFVFLLLLSSGMLFIQCKDLAVQKFVETMATSQQANMPMDINPLIRADSCMAMPNKTIRFCVTMKYVDLDAIDVKSMTEQMKSELTYTIQMNKELEQAKKMKITFSYAYYEKNGRFITEITITPEDYNKPIVKPETSAALGDSDGDVSKAIEIMVKNEKMTLPLKAAEDVTVTECDVLPNNTIQYKCILDNPSEMMADTTAHKKSTMPNMVGMIKQISQLKNIIKNGATLRYVYYDKNNKYLFFINVDKTNL